MDLLSPDYNICTNPGKPGSSLAKNRSNETLVKMSEAQDTCQPVEVTDLDKNTKTIYGSVKAAARALNIDSQYIHNYVNLMQTKPVLNKYELKLIGSPKTKMSNIQRTSMAVEVTDLLKDGLKTIYLSISAAVKELGVHQPSISAFIDKSWKIEKNRIEEGITLN